MRTLYDRLGMRAASRFSLHAAPPTSKFERQLQDIAAGVTALNLTSDALHLATEIAAFEPDLTDEQRVSLILLLVLALAALEEGSTRLPVTGEQSVGPMRRLLAPLCGEAFGADGAERMRLAIEQMLNSASAVGVIGSSLNDYKPLIYSPPYIYQHRILSAEITLTRRLASLIDAEPAQIGPTKIRDLLLELTTAFRNVGGRRIDLSEEQRAAIECAVSARLSIISGGPGTGKTSIVLAIVKVLMSAGIDSQQIALAAPTGKAAYRISETIRANFPGDAKDLTSPQATTVHRLLGYSPALRRFRHHCGNPLGAQVIIVDEASMLDLELMSRLLDAMRPGARLVLLGDADQLPSVSAGAVFRDLARAADDAASPIRRNCVRLTCSYRINREVDGGSTIFNLASAINAGAANLFDGDRVALARRDDAAQLKFAGAEWLCASPAAIGGFLERWYAEHVRLDAELGDLANAVFTATENGFAPAECESLRRLFSRLTRSRILCVTRVLDTGSERINSRLHRRIAHEQGLSSDRDRFLVGEPVMVLRNDYERALFNGDQGLVLRVRRPGFETAPLAIFPRGDNFAAFRIDALKNHLELCYAMTVHKAQGSEFDSVAVIMPEKDLPILSREILYTAVSRARRSVTIVGSRDVIDAGLARKIERYSGVREHLAQSLIESRSA